MFFDGKKRKKKKWESENNKPKMNFFLAFFEKKHKE